MIKIAKILLLIIIAACWGMLCAYMFEPPIYYILSIIGGIIIGLSWNYIWNMFTNK